MKMRREIGKARVIQKHNDVEEKTLMPLGEDVSWYKILRDVSLNTVVELAVYEEVEPKRMLIVPEGVQIIKDDMPGHCSGYILALKGKTIGWFNGNGTEGTVWNGYGRDRVSVSFTNERIKEKLADLGWHGFGWKIEEPDLSRYEKFSVWPIGYFIEDYPKYQTAINRGNALFDHRGVKTVFVHGWTVGGQVDLLKTLTKEEIENG